MSAAPNDPSYTVVVGVSATSKSPAALAWAATQARTHHGRLVAVRVLKRPTTSPDAATSATEVARLEVDVAASLGPDHGAECRVLYGPKRRSLLAVASGADLLVIDAARRPSSSSMLAQRIIAAAACPVVVLPPALSPEPPSKISQAGRAVGEAALKAVGTSGRPGYGYHPPQRP